MRWVTLFLIPCLSFGQTFHSNLLSGRLSNVFIDPVELSYSKFRVFEYNPSDSESVYYGHYKISKRVVNEDVVVCNSFQPIQSYVSINHKNIPSMLLLQFKAQQAKSMLDSLGAILGKETYVTAFEYNKQFMIDEPEPQVHFWEQQDYRVVYFTSYFYSQPVLMLTNKRSEEYYLEIDTTALVNDNFRSIPKVYLTNSYFYNAVGMLHQKQNHPLHNSRFLPAIVFYKLFISING